METPKIFESEYRFCLIMWEHQPIKSSELAKLCKQKLDWSKTTTYTVIKRLSASGGGSSNIFGAFHSALNFKGTHTHFIKLGYKF